MGVDTIKRTRSSGINDETTNLLPDGTIAREEEPKTKWEKIKYHAKQPGNWLVVPLLFLTTMNNVIFKNIELRMENYSYTLTQMQPVMLIPSFFFLTAIRWYFGKINAEQFAFPKWRYIIMAFLFAIYNFLTRFGARGNFVPGAEMVLLAQIIIPYTMVLTMIFLRIRYRWNHFIGAILIIGGIVIAVYPTIQAIKPGALVSIITLLAAPLPQAIVLVYLEYNFQKLDMDLYYASSWINVFEFLIGLPFIFAMVPLGNIPMDELWPNVRNGYVCLFTGENFDPKDDCGTAGFWYIGYWFVNVCFNINLGYGLKTSSATFMSLALVCSLPLSTLAFSWNFLVPGHASPLSWWALGSLLVIFPGLILYKLWSPTILPPKVKDEIKNEEEQIFPTEDEDESSRLSSGEGLIIPKQEIVLERQTRTK